MMRIIWRAGFTCLALGSLVAGGALLGFLFQRTSDAADLDRVRLLVKCEQGELTNVLAALVQTKAEVWDLKTMKRLSVALPDKAPAPKAPAPKAPASTAVPTLRDAGATMHAILAAVRSVQPEAKSATPHVTEMTIQLRRAAFRVTAASATDVDKIRTALEASPYLRRHTKQVQLGALQRNTNGTVQSHVLIAFDETARAAGPAPHLHSIDAHAIEKASSKNKMNFVRASAIAEDPNRSEGYVTHSREYTFQTATNAQLIGLLADLKTAQPGLVVYELRWKQGGNGHILKPIIRLGGRSPLKP